MVQEISDTDQLYVEVIQGCTNNHSKRIIIMPTLRVSHQTASGTCPSYRQYQRDTWPKLCYCTSQRFSSNSERSVCVSCLLENCRVPYFVLECLHLHSLFCGDYIKECIRMFGNDCPPCRTVLVTGISKRDLHQASCLHHQDTNNARFILLRHS